MDHVSRQSGHGCSNLPHNVTRIHCRQCHMHAHKHALTHMHILTHNFYQIFVKGGIQCFWREVKNTYTVPSCISVLGLLLAKLLNQGHRFSQLSFIQSITFKAQYCYKTLAIFTLPRPDHHVVKNQTQEWKAQPNMNVHGIYTFLDSPSKRVLYS